MQRSNPCFFIAYSPEELAEREKHDYPVELCICQQKDCIQVQMYGIPLAGSTFEDLRRQVKEEDGEKVYAVYKVLTVTPPVLLAVSMQSGFAFTRFHEFTQPQPGYPQGFCQLLGYYAYTDCISVITGEDTDDE